MSRRRQRLRGAGGLAVGTALALTLSGCAGFGELGQAPGVTTITLASVNNPQMQDLATLIPQFNAEHPDIRVNLLMMEENDLRNATTQDVATQGGQYDVMTVGSYEVPIWGKNGWLADVTDKMAEDPSYEADDFFPPIKESASVDGRTYAAPFYGESSFLMYRKDLLAEAGVEMPERPTWQQVADIARQLKTDERAGICLRAKPGWGEMFAPLTTVVNTFGGQWYDDQWNAKVNDQGFTDATRFYVDTLAESGQRDPVSFGFTECLNLFSQGNAAMWYDATSAAGSLESESSAVKGKVGYVRAPVEKTENSGWLFSWNLAISNESDSKDAAWEFVKWASSKEYVELVGNELSWAQAPSGTRASTFELAEYKQAGGEFAPLTAEIMQEVDPKQPGVAPQNWVGIQYVTIPQFQDVGNQTSQLIADVVAGRRELDSALNDGQQIAQRAGDQQKQEEGK
ncbi:MAG: sugar ABC transporter substrate-binding protein [Propionibacteriales bacterium]|nr:sugar ABC transporter substrate-binding protein [Propionibacteriales bacterium]